MDPTQELKSTIEKIGVAFEEFKAENNKLIAKGVRDALAEAKLDKLGQALDDLTGKKEDLEKRIKAAESNSEEMERKLNALRFEGNKGSNEIEQKGLIDFNLQIKAIAADRRLAQPADVDLVGFRAYKAAFSNICRKGRDGVTAEEVKALQVGVEADGGIYVPADTTGRIVQRVYELSPIRAICSVQSISSDRLEGIADIGEAADGWVGEVAARSDTATPQGGKYEIPTFEQYAKPKASQKLLDDASIDIEAWLAGKVANRFARREALAFIAGNGTSQPRGLTTYTVNQTSDDTRAWGVMESVKTGVSSNFAASNPADILFDLETSFRPAYLANANIVTRRSVIRLIRKFKDSTGQYLWQPSLQAGKPATLIGYSLVMCEDMPALAANSLSLAMGDFKEGYQIIDRLGVRMLRDPYTDKPYVVFYSIRRVGGGVLNSEAIKFVEFGT